MLYAIEISFFLFLAYRHYRIFKQSLARNCLYIGIYCVSTVPAIAAYHLSQWLIGMVSSNLILRLVLPLLVLNTAYLGTVTYLCRRCRNDDHPLVSALHRRLLLPRWAERLACGFIGLLLWAVAGLLLCFMVNILSSIPEWRQNISSHSLYLRFLGSSPPPIVDEHAVVNHGGMMPMVHSDPEKIMDAQSGFLNGLRKGWANTRDLIAEKSGSNVVRENLEALQEILNLTPAENTWLMEQNSNLKQLFHHPALLAIMNDDHVIKLIEEVAKGSPLAIYALGDDPNLKALFEDEEVMRVVRSIDLREMRSQIQARRKLGTRVPIGWAVSSINKTLDLDAQLKNASAWKDSGKDISQIMWKPDVHIGLARAGFVFNDTVKRSLGFQFHTQGQVLFLINNQSIKLTEYDGAMTAQVTLDSGRTEFVLLVDFPDATAARSCMVEVFRRP